MMTHFDAIVIGSGPSGVICAEKLTENNVKTLILDYGLEIESEKKKLILNLKKLDFSRWDKKTRDKLRNKDFSKKFSFGSTFVFDKSKSEIGFNYEEVEYSPSLSKGGLSNVWGGSILPYTKNDFANWPIEYEELEKYYLYVISKIGCNYAKDDLCDIFPILKSKNFYGLQNSNQAKYLQKKYKENRSVLKKTGIILGSSRLAVDHNNCIYCGSCLLGCVHSLIYNSSKHLEKLKKNNLFEYRKNILVTKIIEKNNETIVECKNNDGKILNFSANKVYLGAGFISTTKIMLESYRAKNIPLKKLEAKDSQYFLIPAILMKNFKNIDKEKLHTLAQIFVEINNKEISKKMSHLQIYTYSDSIDEYFKNKFSLFYNIFGKLLKNFLYGRIIFIQGYLHSDDSHKANFELKVSDSDSKIFIKKIENKETKKIIYKIIKLLKNNFLKLGFFPLLFFLKIGKFGSGHHSGGTFQMFNTADDIGKTDKYGIPYGFKRTHIIDSSIFPSISSSTITLTAMANSARIANCHNNNL